MKKLSIAIFLAAALAPVWASKVADGYIVKQRYMLGGQGGWDYLSLDYEDRRLFIARDDRIMVMDTADGKLIGEIAGMQHAHGVALIPSLHRGYVSNGNGNNVTVFDLDTLKVTGHIAVSGKDPDAIMYDPVAGRLLTMNGHSNSISVIDPQHGMEIASIPVPGRPEFVVGDGRGGVFVNLEDTGQLAHVDVQARRVLELWSLAPCQGPTGLAFDKGGQRLFSVCANQWMVVTAADGGHQIAKLAIGKKPDAVAFDAMRHLVLSSNGEGTLSLIRQVDADHYEALTPLPTQQYARTLALDPNSHRVFLAAAGSAIKGGPVGGFQILVVAPR